MGCMWEFERRFEECQVYRSRLFVYTLRVDGGRREITLKM
jgi:hypothetical protein